jgi:hypothetical protein
MLEKQRQRELQEAEYAAAKLAAEMEALRNRKTLLQKVQIFFAPAIDLIYKINKTMIVEAKISN